MESILMTPGPTNIPEEVFKAMNKNIHHRTGEFEEIMKSTGERLKRLFNSKNDVVMLLCSGTGGLEASIVNIFSPEDKLLAINCGVFGKRFADIARIYDVDVHEMKIEWGYGIKPDSVEEELKNNKYKVVYSTYSETSTGIKNNIKKIGEIAHKYNCLFIVDVVSALGSLEFNMDEYNVDVAVAGSQKGLMCPPGLSIVFLSDMGWKAVEESRLPKFYFDFRKYRSNAMPYTPGVSLILGLNKSLEMIEAEGIHNVLKRHKKYSDIVKTTVNSIGLKEFPDKDFASEVLTAVYVPENVDEKMLRKLMYDRGIVIAGGQGILKGKIIRIGHMGYVTDEHIIKTMKSLCDSLNISGFPVNTGEIIGKVNNMLEVL